MSDEELAAEYDRREENLRIAVVEFANAIIARAKGDGNLAMRVMLSVMINLSSQLVNIQEKYNNESEAAV